MKTDDTNNNARNNNPAKDGNNGDSANAPKYRLLGESGLVEDEDGNMYSASEIYGYEEPPKPAVSNSPSSSSGASTFEDKTSPAYWDFYYDPRYCGPSRSAYIEKMISRYSNPNNPETKKEPPHSVTPKAKEKANKKQEESSIVSESATEKTNREQKGSPLYVSEAIREKANREQKEVERYGLHPVFREDFSYHYDGLGFVAIVDRDGNKVISNEEYVIISIFLNGLARAQKRKTKKFGFVDRHGNEVIPCVWRSAGEFSEYMAAVVNDDRKCGYVDVTGKLVIPCVWIEAWPFHEGLARVQNYNRRIGMIDQRGRLVIPCTWTGMGDFSEGLAGARDEHGKCGYIDRTGKIVIPFRWKNVWTFSEGLAVVQDFNKRLGFINKSGELVIPCRWKKVNYFKDGLAKVSDSKTFFFKDKWVYIDKQGRIVK